MKQSTLLLGVFTCYLMACQLLAGPSTRAKMGTSNGRLHALLVLFLFRQLLELCWCLVSVFCKLDRYSFCACNEMGGSRQASCPPCFPPEKKRYSPPDLAQLGSLTAVKYSSVSATFLMHMLLRTRPFTNAQTWPQTCKRAPPGVLPYSGILNVVFRKHSLFFPFSFLDVLSSCVKLVMLVQRADSLPLRVLFIRGFFTILVWGLFSD